jgi:hypothetical protein
MFFVDSRKRIELYVLLRTSSDFISDSQIAFMQQLLAYEPRFRITAVKIDSSKLLNWTRFTSKIPEVINGLEITYLKFSQFKKRMNKSNAYCMLTTPYIELYDSSVRSILPQIKVLHLNYGL